MKPQRTQRDSMSMLKNIILVFISSVFSEQVSDPFEFERATHMILTISIIIREVEK
jgi:hypothetical protein